jgi:bifunctional non-homologous end joining protein LigD
MPEMRFVVQEHHARRLHYDFRLEMAGILKSWALPKGPSMNPAEKRLAVLVHDHPLEYLGFEGIIPPGHSGAGPVLVWDKGVYHLPDGQDPLMAVASGKIVVVLDGNKLKGGFTLVRMKGQDENNWLLIKKQDPFSQINWKLKQALTEKRRETLQEKVPPCQAQ